jgi:hypothetical protein
MYAPSIVQARLELASKKLGFRPEYHTPAEVDDFAVRLERRHQDCFAAARMAAQSSDSSRASKINQQTLLKLISNAGRLNSEETRWMQNERALVMCDAEYFLTRYYFILSVENILQHFAFAPRPAQRILFNCFAQLEEMGVAIEILLAKARQLGMTTLVEGLLLLKILFAPGVNAVAASADSGKTREMVRKILTAYDKLPFWLRPVYTRRVESDQGFMYFGDGGVTFQHGEQVNPIAMGSTLISYHISELSSFPDAHALIDVGLMKAVHPNPRVLGVLESTCKGNTGWWHDSYWESKSKWSKGQARLMALFLPFYTAIGMYPNPTEEIAHPIPRHWRPTHDTSRMVAESEEYVRSNDVLSKVLMQDGKPWKMPRSQAHYWEWNFLSAREKGEEKDWFAEMPHTDKVAFQSSYDSVFGKDVIAEADSRRTTKYHVYQIIGQSIEDRHEPDKGDVDGSEAIIPVSYTSRRNTKYSWELIPVSWVEPFSELDDLRDEDSHMGKLFVYLEPEMGYDYSIGIRTSVGISSDPTVIAVNRRGRHEQEPDVQAAEFRDIEVSHVEAYAWGMAIAAYYGKFMKPEFGMSRFREPYVAIEQVTSVGDTTQLQMRKMGYSRFHKMTRYDSKPEDMRKSKAHKIGWYSFGWSTPLINDGFVTYVKNGWYQVNSPYTLYEMDHWEVHSKGDDGKVKFEAGEDTTAYGLSANALAAFCPNDLRSLADRTMKRRMDVGGRPHRPVLDLTPTGAGHTIPLSDMPVIPKHAKILTLRR